jgi:hypothetical protein
VCRIEGRLFNFGEEIVGIAIQSNSASLPQFRREKRPHNRALSAQKPHLSSKAQVLSNFKIVTRCR